MATTITFMRVTFRAAKDEVSSALAPKDGKGNALPVILNAVERMPTPPRANNRHGRLNPARTRGVVASNLRRALQGRDWRARLMASSP